MILGSTTRECFGECEGDSEERPLNVAVHEAGHVPAGLYCGCSMEWVTVRPRGRWLRRTVLRGTNFGAISGIAVGRSAWTFPLQARGYPREVVRACRGPCERALVDQVPGVIAEVQHDDNWSGEDMSYLREFLRTGDGDEENASLILELLSAGERRKSIIREAAERRAEALVTSRKGKLFIYFGREARESAAVCPRSYGSAELLSRRSDPVLP